MADIQSQKLVFFLIKMKSLLCDKNNIWYDVLSGLYTYPQQSMIKITILPNVNMWRKFIFYDKCKIQIVRYFCRVSENMTEKNETTLTGYL